MNTDLLQGHLRDLQGLYERLEEKHPARQRIADRIEECKQDIANHVKAGATS